MLIFTETNNKRPFGSQSKVVHKFTQSGWNYNKTRKMLIFTETNNKRPFGSQSKVVHKFTQSGCGSNCIGKMDGQKNRGTCTLNKNIEQSAICEHWSTCSWLIPCRPPICDILMGLKQCFLLNFSSVIRFTEQNDASA